MHGLPKGLGWGSAHPHQCPVGSVASYFIYADVRLHISMTHRNDRYSDPQWRAMRTAKQVAAKKAKEAAGLSAAAIAALEAAGSGGISVEALLKATEQVWPDEVAAPAKLVVKDGLRPYVTVMTHALQHFRFVLLTRGR